MTPAPPPHAMFSRAEMDRRYDRARELMASRGIDALLISGEENFQYLAGASASIALHHSLTRPNVFILPMDREPIIVTQTGYNLTLGCHVTDLRDYSGLLAFPHDVAVDALIDAVPANGRIGAELGQEQRMGIPVGAYLDLVAALGDAEFVDATDIVINLRIVKSEEELVYIRKAADITSRARQRLFDGLVEPGMTEREVARTLRRLILEEGGDRTSFIHFQLDLPGSKNQFHYDRPLERGTVLAVDTGAYNGMYTVDYARMATLGRATDLQKRVHAAVLEVNRAMADALRPGIKCSELFQLGLEAIERTGVSPDNPARVMKGRMGHGQGMLITEPPSIAAEDDTALEAGMVISTEPGVRSGDVQFLWEDVHVVTQDGHEQLTLETDELREIPF